MGIFGSKKSEQKNTTSTTSNAANPFLQSVLNPVVSSVGGVSNMLNSILGGGFQGYKDAAGFDWATKQGSQGILGNAAARGMLNSGATGKALMKYGNDQANTYLQNYLGNLFQQGTLGLGAGSLLADTATKTGTENSQATQSSKPGLGGIIGGGISRVAGGF